MIASLVWFQIAAALATLAAGLRWRLGSAELSSRSLAILMFCWIAAVTWPFWAAGPASFAATNSELDYPLSLIPSLLVAKGQFLPQLAGGADTYGEIFSGSYLSLQYILLKMFPLPAAHAILKIAGTTVAFGGMFLLARACGVSLLAAFMISALFSISHERMLLITWVHGLGFSWPPLVAWLIVCRQGTRFYWPIAIAIALAVAISSSPTHSVPVILLTALAVGILRQDTNWPRLLLALFLIGVAVLANWHEGLFAKALLGPWTSRGTYRPDPSRIMLDKLVLTAGIVGLSAWTVAHGWRAALRPAAALLLAGLSGPAFMLLTQSVPFLTPLAAINHGNMQIAFAGMAALMLGRGADALRQYRTAFPLAMAFVAAQFAWMAAYIPLVWLSEGGLSQSLSAIKALEQAAWRPQTPTRVVSVTYRLPANTPLLAGLDTADGGYALALRSQERYWAQVVTPHPQETDSGFLGFQPVKIDWKCCTSYDVATFADLDLLRAANVGFILSRVPLHGANLIQIDGPTEAIPPRSSLPMLERLGALVRELRHPAGIRVYALAHPLPRVFAPTSVQIVPDDLPDTEFFARLRDRIALVRQKDAPALNVALGGDARINAFHQDGDKVSVAVDAPSGGIVVLNVPYLPFWTAIANDGTTLPVVQVNGIHMAVRVPSGATSVEFRYHRPLLREVIAAKAGMNQAVR